MGMQVGAGDASVKHEPNVVPMIDIMLVLLIIFMIVTPVIASGFQARIPQGKNIETRPEEGGDVMLGLDRDGNYFLDPGTGTISPVRAENLEDALTRVYEARTTDKIVYFKADANLDYAQIEEAIKVVRKAGVRVMAAITEEKRDTKGLFR